MNISYPMTSSRQNMTPDYHSVNTNYPTEKYKNMLTGYKAGDMYAQAPTFKEDLDRIKGTTNKPEAIGHLARYHAYKLPQTASPYGGKSMGNIATELSSEVMASSKENLQATLAQQMQKLETIAGITPDQKNQLTSVFFSKIFDSTINQDFEDGTQRKAIFEEMGNVIQNSPNKQDHHNAFLMAMMCTKNGELVLSYNKNQPKDFAKHMRNVRDSLDYKNNGNPRDIFEEDANKDIRESDAFWEKEKGVFAGQTHLEKTTNFVEETKKEEKAYLDSLKKKPWWKVIRDGFAMALSIVPLVGPLLESSVYAITGDTQKALNNLKQTYTTPAGLIGVGIDVITTALTICTFGAAAPLAITMGAAAKAAVTRVATKVAFKASEKVIGKVGTNAIVHGSAKLSAGISATIAPIGKGFSKGISATITPIGKGFSKATSTVGQGFTTAKSAFMTTAAKEAAEEKAKKKAAEAIIKEAAKKEAAEAAAKNPTIAAKAENRMLSAMGVSQDALAQATAKEIAAKEAAKEAGDVGFKQTYKTTYQESIEKTALDSTKTNKQVFKDTLTEEYAKQAAKTTGERVKDLAIGTAISGGIVGATHAAIDAADNNGHSTVANGLLLDRVAKEALIGEKKVFSRYAKQGAVDPQTARNLQTIYGDLTVSQRDKVDKLLKHTTPEDKQVFLQTMASFPNIEQQRAYMLKILEQTHRGDDLSSIPTPPRTFLPMQAQPVTVSG